MIVDVPVTILLHSQKKREWERNRKQDKLRDIYAGIERNASSHKENNFTWIIIIIGNRLPACVYVCVYIYILDRIYKDIL